MAIYHLSMKPISRSDGRSSTGAAAYRAGERIVDERTGEIHDYTRKRGIEITNLVLPSETAFVAVNRSALWNAAEAAEKRKDARVAREFEVALPAELPEEMRMLVTLDFAQKLADRYGVAADVAIHAPSRNGDSRNHHAHILCTTRKVGRGENGEPVMGEKSELELSDRKRNELGLPPMNEELVALRELWAKTVNQFLAPERHIDHRSLKAQGITDRLPQVHLGPAVTQMHRRGEKSEKWLLWEQANEALRAAAEEGRRMKREEQELDEAIIDIKTELSDLLQEREQIKSDILEHNDKVRELLPTGISRRLDTLLNSVYYSDGDVILLYEDEVSDELKDIMSRMEGVPSMHLRDALINRDAVATDLAAWDSTFDRLGLAFAPGSYWRRIHGEAREAYLKRDEELDFAPTPSKRSEPLVLTPEQEQELRRKEEMMERVRQMAKLRENSPTARTFKASRGLER